ncbi:MAG TPA: oligosaccharide flippase family protein, partial [Acidimicrobiales bacterium]
MTTRSDVPPPDGHDIGAVEAAEAAVEGVPGALSLAPSSVMPALGGELVLPAGRSVAGAAGGDVAADSVRAGLLQAGPLAIAGLVANGANVIVTVLLARLLTTRGYGELNVLTGLFLIVSMPGSAVIVAVVRRVTGWKGRSAHLVQRWARRMHRRATLVLVVFAATVLAIGGPLSRLLNQHDVAGVDAILIAGGVWILLCLDRGLLQAHRSYRTLSVNLLVEGGVRTVAMLAFVAAGAGPSGAAAGVLVAEVVTAVHARFMADRVWGADARAEGRRWVAREVQDAAARAERRVLVTDLVTAFIALAMTALLQNVDVIVLGREAPTMSGSYA